MNADRARARQLVAQLRNFRRAALVLPDALVLVDGDGRARWFNRAAQNLLGLAWPRDRGFVLADRFAGSELGAWYCAGAATPIDDVPAPSDPLLRLHASMMPFAGDRRLLLARDVSRVARLEQVRRDFVANVSHELRTPLTVIHGYLELLDPDEVPALAPVLGEMRAQSQRMRQIVEDLLELSRLEMQQQLPRERVAMASMLATLQREAVALSHGRHHVRLDDSARVDLAGSAKDLLSAFSNLVSNAVRYTPAGGNIAIAWRTSAQGAEYSVADTGFGIPAEHLSRLTERFYRVSSSRSRASGGTGLGLSIVKHVLGLHDAQLRIESEPGQGSTFTCVFAAASLLEREAEG